MTLGMDLAAAIVVVVATALLTLQVGSNMWLLVCLCHWSQSAVLPILLHCPPTSQFHAKSNDVSLPSS